MSHHRLALTDGARTVSPVLLGVVPFGLVAGAVATQVGLGLSEAVGFSTIVFAGAAQLAAMELIGADAPLAVAIGTALVINLRMLMYSASIAPHLAHEPFRRRVLGAYLLTDQAYAISIAKFQSEPTYDHQWSYFLGSAVTMWTGWQLATIAGVFIGDVVPHWIPLTFAIAATFIAMLIPAITDRPTLVAAVTSGTIAVIAAPLPANLGLPIAAACGITVGSVLAIRRLR